MLILSTFKRTYHLSFWMIKFLFAVFHKTKLSLSQKYCSYYKMLDHSQTGLGSFLINNYSYFWALDPAWAPHDSVLSCRHIVRSVLSDLDLGDKISRRYEQYLLRFRPESCKGPYLPKRPKRFEGTWRIYVIFLITTIWFSRTTGEIVFQPSPVLLQKRRWYWMDPLPCQQEVECLSLQRRP